MFIKEQAEALAEQCPDIRVMISTWGHDDSKLVLRSPRKTWAALSWRLRQPLQRIEEKNKVWEVFHPHLDWSEKLPFGGIKRLIGVNRRNLMYAKRCFGEIDLIHAHVSFPAGYVAAQLSEEFSIPYVLTEHMGPFPFSSLIDNGVPRYEIDQAFTNASCSIAVSPSLASRIASFGFLTPEIIPNMVDERRFLVTSPIARRFVFFTCVAYLNRRA